MATIYAAPDIWAPDRLTVERRMQHALRVINEPGWRQRLAPLGQQGADRRQVRARSDRGPRSP
jgi:hypothetical protein